MDLTPERGRTARLIETAFLGDQIENHTHPTKLKKPPPITPRRFNRFFTPRPRNATGTVKTSRTALRILSGSVVNSRNSQNISLEQSCDVGTPRGKKRKLSFAADESTQSTPATRASFLVSSQEIRSSPTIPERHSPLHRIHQDVPFSDDEEAETDIDTDDSSGSPQHRMSPIRAYHSKTTSGSLLSTRLSGRIRRREPAASDRWQQQTGHFYTSPSDINDSFSQESVALPFCVAACHTNPIIAAGDEEGTIRIIDSGADDPIGMTKNFLRLSPHDNALMDLEFSPDDQYLATACGDQSCQIIDMRTQTSLYTLGGHRCSVKRISFQPGSGNNVLASCGRDGQLNIWDLRCNNTKLASSSRTTAQPMASNMRTLVPIRAIREAHTAGPRSGKVGSLKPNLIPGRADFSVTSLSFLGQTRPHLLVTASEIDTTIKVWDIRAHQNNRRAAVPLACTDEPKSHAFHRRFGITSLVLGTDASRLYALSRDHTVYAYSTAHLILGSSSQLSTASKPSKPGDGSHRGLGPLYGFRHPSLRVQTFWPRLAIRRQTDERTELLAVGSTEDCAVVFTTDERYLTASASKVPPKHTGGKRSRNNNGNRPSMLTRSASAMSANGTLPATDDEDLRIYSHGTPLIRGHDKEVSSLAWTSEGSLITASDDYTVRCWREDPANARRMRDVGERNGERWKKGWADVGIDDFDEEY